MAVVAAHKQRGGSHFTQNTHQRAGLTIFLLVLLQGLMGYFRPSPNPPKDATTEDDASDKTPESFTDTREEEGRAITMSSHSDSDEGQKEKSKTNKHKSFSVIVRQYWEYLHRFLGITLLGLAWYNCQSGIVIQATNYEQDDDTKNDEHLLGYYWNHCCCYLHDGLCHPCRVDAPFVYFFYDCCDSSKRVIKCKG